MAVTSDTKAYILGSEMIGTFDEEIREEYESFTHNEKLIFSRGYFDTNGKLFKLQGIQGIKAFVRIIDDAFKQEFCSILEVPCQDTDKGILFVGVNALELLHKLYRDADYTDFNVNFASYRDLLYCWRPYTRLVNDSSSKYAYGNVFKYKKTLEEAVKPAKAHVTDSGYDLCLVKKIKEENGVIMYDTGIAVEPPLGYYFELVGRSSISKSGYMLANNIGIIDASYRGSLKVALVKINKDAPELELPARLVQLLPRQFVHLDCQEVTDLDDTARAEGGFGSTGKHATIV
jgi:dUTP pyrophosphatase